MARSPEKWLLGSSHWIFHNSSAPIIYAKKVLAIRKAIPKKIRCLDVFFIIFSKFINSELWIEGEKHLLYRIPEGGVRIIVNAQNKKIVNAWQEWSTGASIARLTVGDSPQRAHKIFGIPDREIFFTRGTYLAYDNFGFGIHIVNNQVAGWFLYDKHPKL